MKAKVKFSLVALSVLLFICISSFMVYFKRGEESTSMEIEEKESRRMRLSTRRRTIIRSSARKASVPVSSYSVVKTTPAASVIEDSEDIKADSLSSDASSSSDQDEGDYFSSSKTYEDYMGETASVSGNGFDEDENMVSETAFNDNEMCDTAVDNVSCDSDDEMCDTAAVESTMYDEICDTAAEETSMYDEISNSFAEVSTRNDEITFSAVEETTAEAVSSDDEISNSVAEAVPSGDGICNSGDAIVVDPQVAIRNAQIAAKMAAYRASETESQERTPYDPARIGAGYRYGIERSAIIASRPIELNDCPFNLLFKGYKNRDKIPAKYNGSYTVFVVNSQEIEDNRESMKALLRADQAVFVLQLSQDEMESLLSAEDNVSVLQALADSISTEDIRDQLGYVMAPEDCSPGSLEAFSRAVDDTDMELVVPRKIGAEMKGAVVVNISENPKVALRNLELALNYNNEAVFQYREFTNRWTVSNDVTRRQQQADLQLRMMGLFRLMDHYYISVTIGRQNILHDSFEKFKCGLFDDFIGRNLSIRFAGEVGIDAGGLKREWFEKLAQEIFNPNYGLFLSSETNQNVFYPNDQSFVNSEHLKLFEFVGMFLAKALLEGISINIHLARFVYKHILTIKPELVDLKEINESTYRSLCWILDNDVTDVLEDPFTASYEDFGVHKDVELKLGGNDIILSEDNKAEFVKLKVDFELLFKIKEQLIALTRGFYRVISTDKIMPFEVYELDNLLAGRSEIDVDDWQCNTIYIGFYPNDRQIVRFWNVVRGFNQAQLRKLLQFATGSSGVPIEGFAGLRNRGEIKKFNIINNGDYRRSLPKAHTCYNQIELPQAYDSENQMREKLLLAIEDGADGFEFG